MADIIITNNRKVHEAFSREYEVILTDSYLGVLAQARDRIHAGWRLLTHPLAGSMKPNQTPYRSVALTPGTGTDMESLRLIENSIGIALAFIANRAPRNLPVRVEEDYRTVDLSLLTGALRDCAV